jgi:putative transposase
VPGLVLGVEPICAVLSEHGIKTPSTYYEARNRRPSRRVLRDAEIVALIAANRRERPPLRCRFGVSKMWLAPPVQYWPPPEDGGPVHRG